MFKHIFSLLSFKIYKDTYIYILTYIFIFIQIYIYINILYVTIRYSPYRCIVVHLHEAYIFVSSHVKRDCEYISAQAKKSL